MLHSVDLETACAVEGCPDFGHSLCRNDHSLSPWHSRITVAAVVDQCGKEHVVRAENSKKIADGVRNFLTVDSEWAVTGHGFKFDWLHLAVHGFEIPLERWVGDSLLAAYVLTKKIPDRWLLEYEAKRLELNANGATHRKAGKHSLKTLAPYFLGVEPFWETTIHDNDDYVTKDALYTLGLTQRLEDELYKLGQLTFYKEKLLEWTKMLVTAELRGSAFSLDEMTDLEESLKTRSHELKIRLDEAWGDAHVAYLRSLEAETASRYQEMARTALSRLKTPGPGATERALTKHQVKRAATSERYARMMTDALSKLPRELSYDSPAQMAWLLRDYLGYSITALDGSESTGKEVLERLAHEGHEDVATYLEWRKTNKLLTAFLPTYRELAVKGPDGQTAIHPVYNVSDTKTGRTSSERPNIQQVTSRLKPLFKARPGYKLVGLDEAAIEARLIALYTEDETLFNLVTSGTSIHDFNTKLWFGLGEDVSYSDVKKNYKKNREAAKNVGFALFYHAGWNRVRIAMAQKGFLLTEQQCRQIHKRTKEAYSQAFLRAKEVVDYMEGGGVLPNLLDRPLSVENPEDAYMKAFNKLIQSSASDLLLEGSYRAWKAAPGLGLEAHPTKFVHDYAEFEVRAEHAEEFSKLLTRSLTDFDLQTRFGRVPLEVEGGITDHWE